VINPARHCNAAEDAVVSPKVTRSGAPSTVSNSLLLRLPAILADGQPLAALAQALHQQVHAQACLVVHVSSAPRYLALGLAHSREDSQELRFSTTRLMHQDRERYNQAKAVLASARSQPQATARLWQEPLAQLLANSPSPWLSATSFTNLDVGLAIPTGTEGAGEGMILLLGQRGVMVPPAPGAEPGCMAELAAALATVLQHSYLQQRSQRYRDEVEHLSHLKEDFISTLNHELRTPLTSMMLAIRMLHRPDLTPERSTMYLNILEQQCSREIGLVNDLLLLQNVTTVSPLPSAYQHQTTPLGDALTHVVDQQGEAFAAMDRQLVLEPVQPWLAAAVDPTPLNRALQELLTNARKFSCPGSTISLRVTQDEGNAPAAMIQVTSIGTAIGPEELPFIFDRFRRGRTATRDAIPGTGIGLALVKGLARQMGGTVTVTSHPVGAASTAEAEPNGAEPWQTCFTLRLPQATAVQATG